MSRRKSAAAALAVIAIVAGLTACGGKKKKAAQAPGIDAMLTFEKGIDLLNRHQLRQAMSTLKRLDFTPEMRDEVEPLVRLALADATYYQGTALALIDARNLYLEFVTLNGDHPLAPYAQLQAGQCSLGQVNEPTKDQTETVVAIRELLTVEARWPDSAYVPAARGMLRRARANLAESEFLVGRFYLKRKAYGAAVDRFLGVLHDYPDFPETEKVLFHLGQAHQRNGNDVEARIYLEKLLADYPQGEYSELARQALGSLGDLSARAD